MANKFKLAVIDDHPLMRRGIVDALSEQADFDVVGIGGSAEDAIRVAEQDAPDVILIDAMMPGGGLKAIRQITGKPGCARVIMLSIREDLETVQAALKAGASGYVTKGVAASDLIDAVRRVLSGGHYVSPELAARLLADRLAVEVSSDGMPVRDQPLSERERDLLRLVGQGFSNQEIAESLGLAENTVKHQLTPLFRKLGVRNRTEAALMAGARTGAAAVS